MALREARAKVVMRVILLTGSWIMARAKVVMMLLTMRLWIMADIEARAKVVLMMRMIIWLVMKIILLVKVLKLPLMMRSGW